MWINNLVPTRHFWNQFHQVQVNIMESQLIQKSLDSTERKIRKRIARIGDGLQFLGYKGNNKITELRTILQRESQNS
jgi:NADH/NAD ratio-sensing transcriptional regulator Rex